MSKLNEFEIIRIASFIIFTTYIMFKFYLKTFYFAYEFWFIWFLFTMIIASTNRKISARKLWSPFYIVCFFSLILSFFLWGGLS